MFDSIGSYYKLRIQVGLVVGCVVVLLFSAYTTYAEARYMLAGRTASAALVGVQEVRPGRRETDPVYLRVDYAFTEPDGSNRAESDLMPTDWPVPPGNIVNVQYLVGKNGWSRISGHDRLWLTVPFIVCTTIVTVFLVLFYREFQEHEKRKASW
ncbi:MAG: hypothetical protein KF805_06350 [Phycisphaeraceae bacterium]|nr:hypothetical protein [Phycisphaeraceae bacterium]